MQIFSVSRLVLAPSAASWAALPAAQAGQPSASIVFPRHPDRSVTRPVHRAQQALVPRGTARVLRQVPTLWQQAMALGRAGCLHLRAAALRHHLAQLAPGSRERRIAYFQLRALEGRARSLLAQIACDGIDAAIHQAEADWYTDQAHRHQNLLLVA